MRFKTSYYFIAADYSPGESRLLACGGIDRAVHIINSESGQELNAFLGHRAAVSGVAWGPTEGVLYSYSVDGELIAWDVVTARKLWSRMLEPADFQLEYVPINHFCVRKSAQAEAEIVFGTASGEIQILDGRDGSKKRSLAASKATPITSVACSPDAA